MADVARLRQDMAQATGIVQAGARAMERAASAAKVAISGMVAGLTVGAFVNSIRQSVELADSLNKLSQRTGVATDALSQLQFAAKLSNVSTDDLTTGLRKLNVSMSEGMAGDKAKVEAFKNLGINLKDVTGKAKSADQVLMEIADSFARSTDGATKTAYAVTLLGKAGDQMIPMLNGGGAALKDMMDKADRLGLTITKEFARKAEEFNDNLTIIKASSDKLAISLGGDLVSALGEVTRAMAEAAVSGGKMHALKVGIDAVGDALFNWSGHQQLKAITNLRDDLKRLSVQLNAPVIDLFGQMDGVRAQFEEKTRQLDAALAAYFNLTSKAGAGRGALPDPRSLGDPGSIAQQTATALKPLSGGTSTVESEYAKLIKRIQERLALSGAELKAGRELTEMEKFEAKAIQDIVAAKKQLTPQQIAAVKTKLEEAKATDLLVQIQKSELELAKQIAQQRQQNRNADYEQSAAGLREIQDALIQNLAAVKDRVLSMKDEADALRLAGTLNISLAEAVEMVTIARLEEKRAEKFFEGGEGWQALTREIEARRELLGLLASKAEVDKFRDAWQSIDNTAHDVFTNIFEGGSNVFKRLGQTLKASLLDVLYQMTVRKWIFQIFANVTGGAGGIAGAASQGSGLLSMAGNGLSLYNGVGTFAKGLGSEAIGGTLIGNIAAGYAGVGGSFASTVGAGLATDAMGATVLQGASAATLGSGSAIGGALAAIPVWGWAIIAAAVVAAMVDKGETRSGGQYGYASGGGVSFLAGPSGGDPNSKTVAVGIAATVDGINGMLKALGSTATVVGFKAGYESSEKGRGGVMSGGTLSTGARFGEDGSGSNYDGTFFERASSQSPTLEEALKNFGTDLIQVTLQALQAAGTDLPKTITDILGQSGFDPEMLTDEEAKAVVQRIGAIITAVSQLSTMAQDTGIAKLQGLSFDIKASLITIAGGVEQLAAGINDFYSNFYSDDERRAQTIANIGRALQSVGLSLDGIDLSSEAARAQFRALTEAVDLTTEAGQRQYAVLMSVAGAFASIIPAAEAVAEALGITPAQQDLLDNVNDAVENLARARRAEIEEMETQLATLASTAQRFRQFAADLRGFRDNLLLGDLSPLTPAQKYAEARRQFEAVSAAAKTGDQTALGKLQGISTEFLQASEVYFASSSRYQADFALVQAALGSTASAMDLMATDTELQITIAQAQLSVMKEIHGSARDDTMTVVEAINALTAAVLAAQAGGGSYGSASATVRGLYASAIGNTNPDAEGMHYWTQRLLSGESIESVTGAMQASAAFITARGYAGGGYAMGGIMAGEAGREWIDLQTPGRVYTAGQTAGMFANSEMPGLTREVIARLERLETCFIDGTRAEIGAQFAAADRAADKITEGTGQALGRAAFVRKQATEAGALA